MKKISNSVRIGIVRRRSISPNLNEDHPSSVVQQQIHEDLAKKQYGARRISSAPLRDDFHDPKHIPTVTTAVNSRSHDGANKVYAKEQQRSHIPASPSPPSSFGPHNPKKKTPLIPSKSNWSKKKKIIVGVSIASVITAMVVVAIVLAVLLTRSTGTSTTSTTTASPTVVTAFWSFDTIITDLYGVYNGQLINGAGYSPISSSQPYVGYGRALSTSTASNQSFLVSTPFLDLTYKSFTIEGWIYSTLASFDRGIFSQCQCTTCSNQCLYLTIRGARLYAGFTYSDLSGTTTLSTGTWYHVAFVYNYQTQQQILYLNGVQEAIRSNIGAYQGTNGSIQIASTQIYSSTSFFNGYIDNVGVTTRAKSADEVLRDASLMAYYSFDLPNPTQDNGPNGLNGMSVNTAIISGRVNNAMRLITSGSYFQAYGFYQVPVGVINARPFSFSMWINPLTTTSSTIIQLIGSLTFSTSCVNFLGTYSFSGLTPQLVVFGTYSGQAVITGPFVVSNIWTHISVTYSTTNGYSLYVNGILFGATGSTTYSTSGLLAYLNIGYYSYCSYGATNTYFQGSIDEFYVHSRELTQTDVTTLANP